MPNPLTLEIKDHSIFRGAEVSMRHDPAFGIAPVMPHAALASDMRPSVPSGWRGTGTDSVFVGTRFCTNDGTLPGLQAAIPQRRQ